jgi:lipopolysaccharide transport system permease protein
MSDFDKSFLIYNLFLLKLIFCIAYMAILSVGLGMLISVTMVKYKDVMFAYNFILSLILYVSPVLFPFSSVSGNLKLLLYLNPLTFPIEYMKIIHLNVGTLDFNLILVNSSITILIFLFGYLLFKKVEQTFVDIF